MHKRLENYLGAVGKSLGALPKARQEKELREMREHLLDAFAVSVEAGQSEEEAARAAVEQFGMAQTVGAGIVTAWRREEKLDVLKVFGAAVITPVLLISLLYSLGYVSIFLQGLFDSAFLLHHMAVAGAFVLGLFCLVCGLIGVILGAMVPKQAVRGTFLGMVLCECIRFALIGGRSFQPVHDVAYVVDLSLALTAVSEVFCAWLVSRRRLGRQVRTSVSAF